MALNTTQHHTLRLSYAPVAFERLRTNLISVPLCSTSYVEASQSAQTVRVPNFAWGNTGTYTRNATSAQFNFPLETDGSVDINVSLNQMTDWSTEYIDSVQTYASYLETAVSQRMYIVRNKIDQDIFERMTDSITTAGRIIGASDSVKARVKNNLFDKIAEAAVLLANADAPKPWWIVLPNEVIEAIREDERLPKHSSLGDMMAMEGAISMYSGVNIFTSNNLSDESSGSDRTKIACPVGFPGANQLIMQVPLRIGVKDIEDYDRTGHFVISWYGFRTMYPDAMAKIFVDAASAS